MKSKLIPILLALPVSGVSSVVLAGEKGELAHAINFYEIIVEKFGVHIHDSVQAEWMALPGALVISLLILLFGFGYRSYVEKKISSDDVFPDAKPSLAGFIDFISEFLFNLAKDLIPHHSLEALPLMMAMFVFILTSNLVGIIPGFNAPTSLMSMNVVIGLTSFGFYNYMGIKEHGWGYVKQFTGPVIAIAPLFVLIELIGHLVRPFSLSFRLAANLFGDHLVLGIFTNLTWIIVPALLTFFGILVAFIQSFIFTLLSGIYISLAVSHDH